MKKIIKKWYRVETDTGNDLDESVEWTLNALIKGSAPSNPVIIESKYVKKIFSESCVMTYEAQLIELKQVSVYREGSIVFHGTIDGINDAK